MDEGPDTPDAVVLSVRPIWIWGGRRVQETRHEEDDAAMPITFQVSGGHKPKKLRGPAES